MTKLYVGNIPYSTNDESLNNLFSEYGEVESAVVITDRFSGRSKGFGFVEMTNEDEANNAIEQLDGSEIEGRNIKVNIARERAPRNNSGGGNRGGYRRGREFLIFFL